MADSAVGLSNQVGVGTGIGKGIWRPLKASEVVEKGTMGIFTAGYVLDGTDAASSLFAGIFTGEAGRADAATGRIVPYPQDQTGDGIITASGTDGVTFARMHTKGLFRFTPVNTAAGATSLGKECEISSNQEVDLAAGTTNHVLCGYIVGWSIGGKDWVKYASGALAIVRIDIHCR